MLIYKVFRAAEWAELEAAGETAGAPVDRADGFVHFSTAGQLAGTLARHFAGESGLVLAAVEAGAAGEALRWEPSRGGRALRASLPAARPGRRPLGAAARRGGVEGLP